VAQRNREEEIEIEKNVFRRERKTKRVLMEIRYVTGVEGGKREKRERVRVREGESGKGMISEWGLFLNFQIPKC